MNFETLRLSSDLFFARNNMVYFRNGLLLEQEESLVFARNVKKDLSTDMRCMVGDEGRSLA